MEHAHSTKPTLVLLEDDASLRTLVAEGLRDHGYTVVETDGAAKAASAVDALDGRAILIADRSVGPGGPNGFDAASTALARHPALRAIYVSGTHIAVRHRQLSARERSLLKPFALSQLIGLVRQLEA